MVNDLQKCADKHLSFDEVAPAAICFRTDLKYCKQAIKTLKKLKTKCPIATSD